MNLSNVVKSIFFMVTMTSCSSAEPTIPKYNKVIPGDTVLNEKRISAHEVSYVKAGYRMKYKLKVIRKEGDSLYQLEVFFNPKPDSIPDTIYLNPKSIGFVGRRLVLDAYTINVAFDNGLFSGTLTPSDGSDYKPVVYNKHYPHGAFEPAVINYAISALPLELGYKASIPVFDLNSGSQLLWSNIEVIAREKLQIDGHIFDTWKVRSEGIKRKTIWLSVDKPYAIKMETDSNPGSWQIDVNDVIPSL